MAAVEVSLLVDRELTHACQMIENIVSHGKTAKSEGKLASQMLRGETPDVRCGSGIDGIGHCLTP
jgi:hypothetical protein